MAQPGSCLTTHSRGSFVSCPGRGRVRVRFRVGVRVRVRLRVRVRVDPNPNPNPNRSHNPWRSPRQNSPLADSMVDISV